MEYYTNTNRYWYWYWNRKLEMYGYRKVTYSKKNCLDTVSKQHNVISMGLSKQKSSPIDSYKKQHIPGSKYC